MKTFFCFSNPKTTSSISNLCYLPCLRFLNNFKLHFLVLILIMFTNFSRTFITYPKDQENNAENFMSYLFVIFSDSIFARISIFMSTSSSNKSSISISILLVMVSCLSKLVFTVINYSYSLGSNPLEAILSDSPTCSNKPCGFLIFPSLKN